MKRTEAYLGHLPVAGPAGQPIWPAQPTSFPPPLVIFLLCQEDEQRRGMARAREASATSCFPLATSYLVASLLDAPDDATRLPDPLSLLPRSLDLPPLSAPFPSGARRRRSSPA